MTYLTPHFARLSSSSPHAPVLELDVLYFYVATVLRWSPTSSTSVPLGPESRYLQSLYGPPCPRLINAERGQTILQRRGVRRDRRQENHMLVNQSRPFLIPAFGTWAAVAVGDAFVYSCTLGRRNLLKVHQL